MRYSFTRGREAPTNSAISLCVAGTVSRTDNGGIHSELLGAQYGSVAAEPTFWPLGAEEFTFWGRMPTQTSARQGP
jgi:hypothetical protein